MSIQGTIDLEVEIAALQEENAHLRRCKEILKRAVAMGIVHGYGTAALETELQSMARDFVEEEKRWLGLR